MFNKNRRKKGIVLIIVFLFMVTLTVIVGAFLLAYEKGNILTNGKQKRVADVDEGS